MNNEAGTFVMVLLLVAMGLIIGAAGGCEEGRTRVRIEAVMAGVAEWVIVDETGKTEFRWIQECRP